MANMVSMSSSRMGGGGASLCPADEAGIVVVRGRGLSLEEEERIGKMYFCANFLVHLGNLQFLSDSEVS